jgi:hypothetical protein
VPTVLVNGPFRFFFYSNENDEPPHVHVKRERALAKFWLEPVELDWSTGFAAHVLWQIERIVRDKRKDFLEAWHEHFDD